MFPIKASSFDVANSKLVRSVEVWMMDKTNLYSHIEIIHMNSMGILIQDNKNDKSI